MKDHKANRRKNLFRITSLVLVLASCSSWAGEGVDTSGKREFHIASQPLSSALMEFSQQSEYVVVASADLVAGKYVSEVAGVLTWRDALSKILTGTDLDYDLKDKNTLVFREKPPLSNAQNDNETNSSSVMAKDKDERFIEEMVVTATKRNTSLQQTPMAVSAVSGEAIEKVGAVNIGQIIDTIPGITYINTGTGNQNISIRGVSVGSLVGSTGRRAATTTYLDEFPLGLGTTAVGLVDMERFEVVKGPQGTLYGQSAMGGVVRYITNKPSTDAIKGGLKTRVSSTESGDLSYGANGYLNVPISDSLAFRAAIYNFSDAGIVDNVATGEKDVNDSLTKGGRLALRWTPSEKATIDAMMLINSIKQNAENGSGGNSAHDTYTYSDNGPVNIVPYDINDPKMQSNYLGFSRVSNNTFNLKVAYDFQSFTWVAMGTQKKYSFHIDENDSPWWGIYDNDTNVLWTIDNEFDTRTFETRLSSQDEGRLTWLAGIWYEDETGELREQDPVYTSTGINIFGHDFTNGELAFDVIQFNTANELAGYGEIGYHLTDDLKLSLGYRRSRVELDQGVIRGKGVFGGWYQERIGADESVSENVNTYRINLEYTVNEDVVTFATISSGYRAGGYNAGGLRTATSSYGSDSLWNYEVGIRSSWFDQRLMANVFAYYLDWTDIQLSQWDGETLSGRTQNVGSAEVKGLETELRYLANDNFAVSLNYALIDSAFTEAYIDGQTNAVIAEAGSRLPGSSKHTVALILDWRNSITPDADLFANSNYRYISGRRSELGWGLPDLKGYQLLNFNVGVQHNSGVEVALFVENVFDKRVVFAPWIYGSELNAAIMNMPRVIGLRANYDF